MDTSGRPPEGDRLSLFAPDGLRLCLMSLTSQLAGLGSPDIQITSDAKAASQTKPAKFTAFFS